MSTRLNHVLATAGVTSGFVVVIGSGFLFHGQAVPAELVPAYIPSVAVFAVTLAVLLVRWVRWMRARLERAMLRRRLNRERETLRQQRVAELRADSNPKRRKYAARVERGEWWSNEQIDYEEDKTLLVTCIHLQPIERDMRAAGVEMNPLGNKQVDARCIIDKTVWQSHYPHAYPVEYVERVWYERAVPTEEVDLVCATCLSKIHVWHQGYADRLPWFPSSPVGSE